MSAPPYSNFVRLLLHLTVEKLWHKTEEGCLFVGSELLAELVAEAKEEAARTGDDAFVSEADIVTNWAYRSFFPDLVPFFSSVADLRSYRGDVPLRPLASDFYLRLRCCLSPRPLLDSFNSSSLLPSQSVPPSPLALSSH